LPEDIYLRQEFSAPITSLDTSKNGSSHLSPEEVVAEIEIINKKRVQTCELYTYTMDRTWHVNKKAVPSHLSPLVGEKHPALCIMALVLDGNGKSVGDKTELGLPVKVIQV